MTKKIINGTIYDTEKAEVVLHVEWHTYHGNLSGGEPTLRHERGVYRGKNGTLFGATYDEEGYGRDRNGCTGAFTRRYSDITPFFHSPDSTIVRWCEEQDCFDIDAVAKAFPDGVQEA
jgi:hypothetical protein